MSAFLHDPEAVLDYTVDWTAWLAEGETIATATATVTDGITLDASTSDDTTTTAWISGGTSGNLERVTFHVITTDDRQDDRTITLRVTDR